MGGLNRKNKDWSTDLTSQERPGREAGPLCSFNNPNVENALGQLTADYQDGMVPRMDAAGRF
jgi:hypothetical protein